jgi:dTMP kinase
MIALQAHRLRSVGFGVRTIANDSRDSMFLSLDGLDGAGKSTQVALLRDWLESQGQRVVICRDPGTTALGEAVRQVLLDHRHEGMSRRAEMLLYMAARAQMVDEILGPALTAGTTVISDRYLLANVVYQGHAGGLDPASVWEIGRLATAGIVPDLTIVLDLPPEAAAVRMRRELDRMESQGDAFRRRVREGFLHEAARDPDRIVVIDAARPIDEVQSEIRSLVQQRTQQPIHPAGVRHA